LAFNERVLINQTCWAQPNNC